MKTTRRGVSIRSRRSFVTAISGKATTPTDAVSRALRSPLPINDLPLKISTWTYKEPGSSKVRVLIAAEAERLIDQVLDYTVGMAMVNKQGRGVGPPVELRKLVEKSGDPGTAVYSGMMSVDPGQYKVILSMSDSEGRIGSVSRAVTAFQMDGPGIAMGDLIVGGYSGGAKTVLEPTIEPAISGAMAALMEVYGSQTAGLEATLEILSNENSPPLATQTMRISAGPSPEVATASTQFNTTALPPGRYLARGTLRQGGKAQGHLIRPFRIVADAAAAASGVPSTVSAIPSEMVMLLLGGVSNFDRKELLTPAMITSMFAIAESRPAGSKAAMKEARGGDLGAAAMTALGENDQALASFLKGLELYQSAQLERAAMQFQSSMQIRPDVRAGAVVARRIAGGSESPRKRPDFQSASTTPRGIRRSRLRRRGNGSGRTAGARHPRRSSSRRNNRTRMRDRRRRWESLMCSVAQRRCGHGVHVLPRDESTDSAALLGAIFAPTHDT